MHEILTVSIPAITAIIGMVIGAFLPHKLQEKFKARLKQLARTI